MKITPLGFSRKLISRAALCIHSGRLLRKESLRALLLIQILLWPAPPLRAARDAASFICGTYPGRVLTELSLHRQFELERARRSIVPLRDSATAALDVGHVAVLPDDGTLVAAANTFDLDGRALLFDASGAGYTVRTAAGSIDTAAADQGELLNPQPATNPQNIGDDGTRLVSLPFAFPFFGQSHSAVFINSDGNLTFAQSDTASTPRSLSRFLTGPPRIAPYFADLDPSVSGRLTVFSSASRFVVSWIQVPDFASAGTGPTETFQLTLTPGGGIQMAYGGINGRDALVGISPGALTSPSSPMDLSLGDGATVRDGAIGEVFSLTNSLDLAAVTKRFYQTHDDAYEFLVVFTNFDFEQGGAFAFELNISNQVTGIGLERFVNPPQFDFSSQFGSRGRLESLLTMGNLSRYPADPSAVFLRSVDSTLSVMGQEAGHRFLSYAGWSDPNGSSRSTALLGRDLQHWSFFFNSEASVMEGNRIRDNSNGTFTTTAAVEQYNEIDQYLMGLRDPGEVGPSFLVQNPSPSRSPASPPALNVSFSGTRSDVLLSQIISANGPRVPTAVTAPKRFNFAFILVSSRNNPASADQIAKVDRIRRDWESFFQRATSFRGTASASLAQSLRLQPASLGLLAGTAATGRIVLQSPPASEIRVSLSSSNSSAVRAPSQLTIPAGATSAEFPIAAVSAGRVQLDATAPGFETASAVVESLPSVSSGSVSLSITQGNNQTGPAGGGLPQPLQVRLQDSNRISYASVPVVFAVTSGAAAVTSPSVLTDTSGVAVTQVQLGVTPGPVAVTARVPGSSLSAQFSLSVSDGPFVPPGGVVNGASYLPAGVLPSPGSIFSIFGTRLASSAASSSSLPLPATLGETRVEIDGVAAPLYFVSPSQINAQAPAELSPGNRSVVVRNGSSVSPAVSVSLLRASPGIFSRDSSGAGAGAILDAGTGAPVSAVQPALPGQFVSVFATGLGAVSPLVASGQPAPAAPVSRTTLAVSATVRGVPAIVDFAGLAPGFAGLYQVNVLVPELAPGLAEIILTVDGRASNTVTMEIGSR